MGVCLDSKTMSHLFLFFLFFFACKQFFFHLSCPPAIFLLLTTHHLSLCVPLLIARLCFIPIPVFSVSVAPPLFSRSAVWNVVLSVVLLCNCDTSFSVGLAPRSPYLLRLHWVSPPQSGLEAQWPFTHPTPCQLFVLTSLPTCTYCGQTYKLNLYPSLAMR